MTTDDKNRTVLSIDCMGGDNGPEAVIGGVAIFLKNTQDSDVLLHGDEALLNPIVEKLGLKARVDVRHAPDVVQMTDKPSQVLRRGKATSMWSAIEAVRSGEADVCISCGNTGALMAMSMLRLRKAEGISRPAIACLWPSRNAQGFNIMLDAGADIRADQDDLLTYALMGASYARNGFNLARPRIGLLNVGVEEHKGKAELKVAHEMISDAAARGEYEFSGFVEGGDIPSADVDVIVTDGFTGNVALKTGEGTARFVGEMLREALYKNIFSKIGALFARRSLQGLAKRIDPRRVNGGVFLGLNKTVVKSHGSADRTGNAAAFMLAERLARTGFSEKIAHRVASALTVAQDSEGAEDPNPR